MMHLGSAFPKLVYGNVGGIGAASGRWFKSYLSECNQKCSLNGRLTSNPSLLCGIPQGTILGPLLFLIYNDLHFIFASNITSDTECHLNEDLANLTKWLIDNHLL